MSKQYKNGKCSCWRKIDKELSKYNTTLSYVYHFDGGVSLLVATHKTSDAKPGNRARSVLASYCPFCGGKLNKGKG